MKVKNEIVIRCIFGISLLFAAATSSTGMSCQVFGFHASLLDNLGSSCPKNYSKEDRDRDGLLDWKGNKAYGDFIFLNDYDIDGDGVPNVFDDDPLIPSSKRYSKRNRFPERLLAKEDGRLRNFQTKFFDETGIMFVSYSNKVKKNLLDALGILFSSKIGGVLKKSVSRLQYILHYDQLAREEILGLYVEPANSMVLSDKLSQKSVTEVIQTLSHELGHALIFSKLNPSQLIQMANRYGNWNLTSYENYYHPEFFKKFSGIKKGDSFPTSYSFTNAHEWFCENFSHYVLKKLGLKNLMDTKLEGYFDRLLNIK